MNDGDGLDPADNTFSSKVWGHSLLRAGATLALENEVQREQVFPLLLGPVGGVTGAPANLSQTLQLIQEINALLRTPGATLTWQPLGVANATTFDLLSGQVDIDYSYRKEGQFWTEVTMRAFVQPFGRTAAPRPYASASAVGPLLLVSPYASGAAPAIVASSTGYGASGGVYGPNGASGGISYWGSPSLAGDAPALLQVAFQGPSEAPDGPTPATAVSLLPDANYYPLIPTRYMAIFNSSGASLQSSANAVGSSYWGFSAGASGAIRSPLTSSGANVNLPTSRAPVPVSYSGQQRLLAIARASPTGGASQAATISTITDGTLVAASQAGSIPVGYGWQAVDMGTYTLRASQVPPYDGVYFAIGTSNAAVDLTGFVSLPDNNTWFMGAGQQPFLNSIAWIGYNTLVLDDVAGEQYAYGGYNQSNAPSVATALQNVIRMTQYSRGLVPQPDPKNGLPILAIMSVGIGAPLPLGASPNSVNQRLSVQVTALERYRYVSS